MDPGILSQKLARLFAVEYKLFAALDRLAEARADHAVILALYEKGLADAEEIAVKRAKLNGLEHKFRELRRELVNAQDAISDHLERAPS